MKKVKKFDPFENLVLDEYEKGLEQALERGEFVRSENFKETNKMMEEAARRYVELRESKSITLRVSKKDLIRVKARAKRSNIGYQTLINLLITSYAEGKTSLHI